MADITKTRSAVGDRDIISWLTLTSSDAAGTPYEPERTRAAIAAVQFTGTFGGATAILQGSNDGTNWITLDDTGGDAISLTAAGYAEVSTAMAYIRPSTSGGDGTQDIDCILSARG